jgi:hypothetical protein
LFYPENPFRYFSAARGPEKGNRVIFLSVRLRQTFCFHDFKNIQHDEKNNLFGLGGTFPV